MTRLAPALALTLVLASCGAPQGGDVLRVGSQRGGTKAVMVASGALEGAPYKVEWAEFAAAQPLLEAVGANAIDVGVTGDAPFIFAYRSGSPIKAVGVQTVRPRPAGALAIIVPHASPARSITDLKGKKIATTRGSVGHYLVIRALEAAHLPPDWVELTFLAPGDARAAFSSGAIDGWATWTPYLQPALKDGAKSIADGRDLVNGYGLDVASDAAITAKAEILRDFLKREAKALDWARRNPEPYAVVLAKETGLPLDNARDYAAKNARTAAPIDDALVADLERVAEGFERAGAARSERDLSGGFDRSFATIGPAARQ